jgi:hypothetical protein
VWDTACGETGGRGGFLHYVEDGSGELCFWWEFVAGRVDITVPPGAAWDPEWTREGKAWASGRREEILFRLIRGARGFAGTVSSLDVHHDVIEIRF